MTKIALVATLLPVAFAVREMVSQDSLGADVAEAMPEANILQMRRSAAENLRAMYPLDDYWMETCTDAAFNPMGLVTTMKSFFMLEAKEAFPEMVGQQELIDGFNGCIVQEQMNFASMANAMNPAQMANMGPPSINPFNLVPNVKPPSFNPFDPVPNVNAPSFNPFDPLSNLNNMAKPLRETFDPSVKMCKALRACTHKTFEALTLEKASPSVMKGMKNFVADIEFPDVPDELKEVLMGLFMSYFDKATLTLKMPMAFSYLQDLPPPTDLDMTNPASRKEASKAMGSTLQGAGPFTHKMLQSTGDKVSAELQEVLAAFKDSISPMTHRELMHQLKAASLSPMESPKLQGKFMINLPDAGLGPSGNHLAPTKATSSASIGQGHLLQGTMPGSGKAWLKVMRRFLDEKLTDEYAILDSLTPEGSNTAKGMREVKQSVRNELDWEQEGRFMRRGMELYHEKRPGLRSVQLYQALPADRPVVLVMEALGGSTLSGWMSTPTADPKEACEAARMYGEAFQVWSTEALAGSGFFHGDPHAGNMMIDFSKGSEEGFLTFIDYGNSFEVSDPIATLSLPFLLFLLGCLLDSPGMSVHAFEWQDAGMKAKAAKEIKQAWKDFHILEGSISWLVKGKGMLAAVADFISVALGVAVEQVPISLVGSALKGWTDTVHSWVALAPDDMVDELQQRLAKAFAVLFTYQHSMEFPAGLFGFSRALDLFTNSFKQIREKKGDMLRASGCEHHLQHPLIQILNAFANHGASKLVTQSSVQTLQGSHKLVKDIIDIAWNR